MFGFYSVDAFGENAGKYVTKIGSGFGYGEEIPLVPSGPLIIAALSKYVNICRKFKHASLPINLFCFVGTRNLTC